MYCGIDLGSRHVKIVLLDATGEQTGCYQANTIDFYRQRGRMSEGQLVLDLQHLPGISWEAVSAVVSTGYGRQTVKIKNTKVIPEIKAHVRGAAHATQKQDFTLLDLGGQDSKVALVRQGKVVDFMTNDKCAASTGRYLENMAAVLDIDWQELSRYFQNPVDLSATCAIFGETELIGKIVEGYEIPALAAGVNHTIFKRVKPMLHRLLQGGPLVFTGGVAQNQAIRTILEQELQVPVLVPENPGFMGALGCALTAVQEKGQSL